MYIYFADVNVEGSTVNSFANNNTEKLRTFQSS